MSPAPSQEDVMEQEVATQLERLDFHVQTNRAYEDTDEGKSREMDVWAIKRRWQRDAARPTAIDGASKMKKPDIAVFVGSLTQCPVDQPAPQPCLAGRGRQPLHLHAR